LIAAKSNSEKRSTYSFGVSALRMQYARKYRGQ
jgi:hypothetical protein